MKLLPLIVPLVIMTLSLGWYAPALMWGAKMTVAAAAMEETGDHSGLTDLLDGPAPLALWRNNKKLQAVFSSDTLTNEREVTIHRNVPFESLLAPGEALPTPEFHHLYAAARAPALLEPYCAEILQHLALKCQLTQTSAFVDRGRVSVTGKFSYIPAFELGDPDSVENGTVLETGYFDIFNDYKKPAGSKRLPNSLEGRAQGMARAMEMCGHIRAQFGNCVIRDISLNSAHYGIEKNALLVTAKFVTYADKNQYREKTFEDEVGRILVAEYLDSN